MSTQDLLTCGEWLVPEEHRVETRMAYRPKTDTDPGFKPHYIKQVEVAVYHYTAVNFHSALRMLTQEGMLDCAECGGSGKIEASKDRTCMLCKGAGKFANTPRSAHFLIGLTGVIWQLAPLSWRTWHAGGPSSKWQGKPVNSRSIGIEVENYGPLDLKGNQLYTWVGSRVVRPSPVWRDNRGQWWQEYVPAQVEALKTLTEKLCFAFPYLTQGKDTLVGHQDVDPKRKRDPGPCFPWAEVIDVQADVRAELMAEEEDARDDDP